MRTLVLAAVLGAVAVLGVGGLSHAAANGGDDAGGPEPFGHGVVHGGRGPH